MGHSLSHGRRREQVEKMALAWTVLAMMKVKEALVLESLLLKDQGASPLGSDADALVSSMPCLHGS